MQAKRLLFILAGAVAVGLTGIAIVPYRFRSHALGRDSKFPISAHPFAPPRLDRWRIVGPGGGGGQFVPSISPLDPNIVLVACDMGGAYISVDAGTSWREFNLHGVVAKFGFDPLNRSTIYASAGYAGLLRSEDLGRSWNVVFPSVAPSLQLLDDETDGLVLSNGKYLGSVGAFAIDPAEAKTIYLVAGTTLFVSRDYGKSWDQKGDVGPTKGIFVDPRPRASNHALYLTGSGTIRVFENGVVRTTSPAPGIERLRDTVVTFPADGTKPWIYMASDVAFHDAKAFGGILLSKDGGQSWKSVNDGFNDTVGKSYPDIRAVAVDPRNPATAYISYSNLSTLSTGREKFFGVAKTSDAGSTWKLTWKESTDSAPNITDAWISQSLGTDWSGNPLNLGIAPSNPNIVFGTDLGRTMRTTDGGQTWQAVYSQRVSENAYTSTGLDVTTNYGVHFDPFDSSRIFISYTDIGLFRSEDGGTSWIHSLNGIPPRWWNTVYWAAFDPAVRGRVWAVACDRHDLPRARLIRNWKDRKQIHGGVIVSDDGGRSWRTSNRGMPEIGATHILMDPSSPPEARVLYVAAFGAGVYKSIDGGKSWSLKGNGLPGPVPLVWRLAQGKDGMLYAVLARRSEDGTFGNENDGMLFRSGDAAETWERVTLPEGLNGPMSLTVDAENPARLYLSAWARFTAGKPDSTEGGIFLSTDGGHKWQNVLNADQHIYDVTTDPANSNILYACGFEASAWRSADRGVTWRRIRGYNFKHGHRVIPDPRDSSKIFITTFGSSVWYGPAEGDPDAPEDISTPELRYTK